MNDVAISLYRNLTWWPRQIVAQRLRQQQAFPIGILFYHRIADEHQTPWTMSCADFARQIDWLLDNYEIISLREAQRRISATENPGPCIAITFDDGYAENVDYAIPLLLDRQIPFSYFVTTDFVRTGEFFPHDLRLNLRLPPNTISQIRELASAGVEIGAHTRTHIDCGKQNKKTLYQEIIGSKQDLEDWLGQSVDYFAFPFGLPDNTNQTAIDLIVEGSYAGFCSAYGAWNWTNSNAFHLKRIHADPGLERFKNWLTYDPRKLHDRHQLPFELPSLTPVASRHVEFV
ncbi:MAG: polysaccharide deacetylase family protein [Planctomycetales bacterium]|nr:polysaccharide deacetylase family protein [Planctomycetales bacterium]